MCKLLILNPIQYSLFMIIVHSTNPYILIIKLYFVQHIYELANIINFIYNHILLLSSSYWEALKSFAKEFIIVSTPNNYNLSKS